MIDKQNPNYSDTPGRRPKSSIYRLDVRRKPSHVDVSIITPYWNTEDFFLETAGSVFNQSLQNWEWIIVDDGSTDILALERLKKIAEQDSRVTIIRQANSGPSAARNSGFKSSSGRFICLLDSDDMIEPTYLEKCVWFLDSNPEFGFCNSHSVVFYEAQYLWTRGFETGKVHLRQNSGPPISVIRREAFSACGGFDESIRVGHEDWDFWLALAKCGYWGYTIQEFLQWYRKRKAGRFEQIMQVQDANTQFEKRMLDKFRGLDKHFPEPKRHHPQPYERLPKESCVLNPLLSNNSGRRILFLVPWMVIGGADRVNLDLIRELVKGGHEVTICATLSADHKLAPEFASVTPDIFVLPNFLSLSDYPRFLLYLIDTRHIDTVVITGSTVGYLLLPYLRSKAVNTTFVDLCHVEEPHWLNGGHPRFGVGYQEALDLNIVTNRHLSTWMQDRGAEAERIRVLYMGVEPRPNTIPQDRKQALKGTLGIEADTAVIIFAGRICAQKRPEILARIFQEAQKENLKFCGLIIGDGDQRHELERLIAQYRIGGCVKMLGSLPHEQWIKHLEISDILLMPSEYEGISLALLEAMSMGVVPVISNVGGQDEIVDSEAGYLIGRDDNELRGYIDALQELIENVKLRNQKSKHCRSLISSKYSLQCAVTAFESMLNEAEELRLQRPRHPTSAGFAEELAIGAIENRRLSEAVDWLWNSRNNLTIDQHAKRRTSTFKSVVLRILIRIRSTNFGQFLLRYARATKFGQAVLTRLIRYFA